MRPQTVRFREAPLFKRDDIQVEAAPPTSTLGGGMAEGLLQRLGLLAPTESRQYLYKLSPKSIQGLREKLVLGQLELSWRGHLGESGHVQSTVEYSPEAAVAAAVAAAAPAASTGGGSTAGLDLQREVSLSVEEVPGVIMAETVFEVICRLNNRGGAERDLQLDWQDQGAHEQAEAARAAAATEDPQPLGPSRAKHVCASVCAAPTLNAAGQPRVTLSPR